MKNLAIIPARGGSKRIPRKNIRNFLGKPIIAYSVETAIASGIFNEIIVSTEDEEIASIAKKYGAKVPFLRSIKNASDYATTADVILEVLGNYNQKFDNICCIYPTAPFITKDILKKSYNKLIENKLDTVFPVVKFSYPIQRSLKISGEKINMVWPEHLNSRSQDLEARYHDVGQFYWFNSQIFIKKKKLFTENSGFVEVSEISVQDIDNETDWSLAELKYQISQNKI